MVGGRLIPHQMPFHVQRQLPREHKRSWTIVSFAFVWFRVVVHVLDVYAQFGFARIFLIAFRALVFGSGGVHVAQVGPYGGFTFEFALTNVALETIFAVNGAMRSLTASRCELEATHIAFKWIRRASVAQMMDNVGGNGKRTLAI